MPQYAWKGITLEGKACRGITRASSPAELELMLTAEQVGLVRAKKVRTVRFSSWKLQDSYDLFSNLAVLLESGLFLTEALKLYRDQLPRGLAYEVVTDLVEQVSKGSSFSMALEHYRDYIGDLNISLVRAGEEVGQLSRALQLLATSLEHQKAIRQRLQSAVLSPIITLSLFLIISTLVLVFFVPRFASFFDQAGRQLPWATRSLVMLSNVVRCYGLYAVVFIVSTGVLWWRARTHILLRSLKDRIILMVPGLCSLAEKKALVAWLTSLALLTRGTINVVHALTIAQGAVANTVLRSWYAELVALVNHGQALSSALEHQGFPQSLHAMVKIGEESGRLPLMLERCAQMYETRMIKRMELVSALVGPCLLILLGCLIALLIMAIYVPMLELSSAIQC